MSRLSAGEDKLMKSNKGVFITLEGGEGSGKSTLIEQIRQYWAHLGNDLVITREPGGVHLAEQIRELILNPEHEMDGITEALLYAAARRQHLTEKIIPALENGAVVICDRYIDSSLAYQGHARGLGIDTVYQLNRIAIEGILPVLTLFLDVPPEEGLIRIQANHEREKNRLDMETLDFHRKVREGYTMLLEQFPDRIVRIDANKEQHAVWNEVKSYLDKILPS